ncbi:hypothetical protein Ahy_A09g041882 [Arachis hypogaea]|uniref:Aminotransferase-like plant mobile domain-containing protein n=1 Tax=Arachis hypogaea TaxID=3818 RepID=A0A445BE20_ARAHY|nr:hypothetical protein Ahy_A09g041882 [Arachis hypogaea]
MGDNPYRLYRLDGVAHIAGVINEEKFAMNCSWFQEIFGGLPEGADEPTIRGWLPYVDRLEDMRGYNWGSTALSWLYRCMCCVANRHVVKLAGPLQLLHS